MNERRLRYLKKLLYLMGAIASATTSLSFFAGAAGLSGIALLVWYFFAAMAAILTLACMMGFALDNT